MRTNLFNKNALVFLAASCFVVIVATAIKVQTAQRSAPPTAQSAAVPVGIALPRPGGFQIQLDQARLQAQLNAQNQRMPEKSKGDLRAGPTYANRAVFGSAVEKEAMIKLNQLFPRGVPPGMESKVKITVSVSINPPEVTISIEW